MFVTTVPISMLLVIFLVILGMRRSNDLKILLMGIEVTLVGAVILIAFHLPTPFWLAPFVLVMFGLVVSFIGFYRKN